MMSFFLLFCVIFLEINGQSNTWPIVVSREAGNNKVSIGNSFKFVTASKSNILQESLLRYEKLITRFPSKGSLISCTVEVSSDDETLDFEHLSESYKIDIEDNNKCSITAKSIYGAMHGLETFSQELIRTENENGNEHEDAITNIAVPLHITDEPVYTHRGMMLDTSRHYLSIDKIKQSVDAMVISKLNVLHLHLVDAESFPFDSPSSPRLVLGAYSNKAIYTLKDMEDLKLYAQNRGVLLILEIESPGHAATLIHSYPNLMAKCFQKYYYNYNDFALDPTLEKTYEIVSGALKDASSTGAARLHLGGDEVVYGCWEQDRQLNERMEEMQVSSYPALLTQYAIELQNQVLQQSNKDNQDNKEKEVTWWQDIYDAMVDANTNDDSNNNKSSMKLDTNTTIFQVWRGDGSDIQSITTAGYRVVASPDNYWYLDKNYKWDVLYYYDPAKNLTTEAIQNKLLLGGEVVMFGEMVDDSNVIQKTQPLAATVAERLWSAPSAQPDDPIDSRIGTCVKDCTNSDLVLERLKTLRCRMVSRGIPAAPIAPSHCQGEFI